MADVDFLPPNPPGEPLARDSNPITQRATTCVCLRTDRALSEQTVGIPRSAAQSGLPWRYLMNLLDGSTSQQTMPSAGRESMVTRIREDFVIVITERSNASKRIPSRANAERAFSNLCDHLKARERRVKELSMGHMTERGESPGSTEESGGVSGDGSRTRRRCGGCGRAGAGD